MSESESSLTTIGSNLAEGLGLFLAMREINLAFFLPLVLAPSFRSSLSGCRLSNFSLFSHNHRRIQR
jgi:hypothetical protein